ncbi:MAG: hypothetical protein ACYDCL_20945 [Myxococcales bacterium]
MATAKSKEGLRAARLLMVLSSCSPLFILWGIRGNRLVPDRIFLPLCAALILLPYGALWARIRIARRSSDRRELVVGSAEDHRDHLLVYLFAMLLPFYSIDLASWRDLAAMNVAIAFVVFLFWSLNLHYMNIAFALRGYRVYTISSPRDGNDLTGRTGLVLISRRVTLSGGEKILGYRLSDSVYLEDASDA